MTIREYRYYDAERKALDWDHLLEDLSQASEGDVVLYTVVAIIRLVLTLPVTMARISRTFGEKRLVATL